ncbi:MAG: cache domain-containing protein [Solidesulfovibrio sp.]|uniref:cache domain-containing protein n=1 Tax=Solidesulfovibrio sp. TaxID=2910990 RepID=UPI002B20A866|nr:cache domain-containing protein [Solidesulfovibrio sp.]MEA4857588.1 cache domain-containing protein [Solidesulfovibrio sp.]
MKRSLVIWTMVVTSIVWAAAAFAGETPEDAKAMVDEVVAFYKANGKDKTLAEINNPHGKFVKGELYAYAYDLKGTIIAHGNNQKLAGKSMYDAQDPDGVYFAREFMKVGPKGGWVNCKWKNPLTNKVQDKKHYIIQVDDVIFGCGAYI